MSRPSKPFLLVSILVCVVCCVRHSIAQSTSTIQGEVSASGKVVSGATIELQPSKGPRRIARTNDRGRYIFPSMPPGAYVLRISAPGFRTVRIEIDLLLNRNADLDVALELSALREEVNVSTTGYRVDRSSSASATAITPRQILETPLNGRNYLDLLQLVGGVAVNRQADPGSDSSLSVLGERGRNTIYLIDGFPNQDMFNGGVSVQFNQDAIAEFQVLTSGYGAEFGRGSGGVVNVATRIGSNAWRGTGAVFFRNHVLDTSNVAGKGAPFLRRSDGTFSIGGPLVRDRVFFFGSAGRISERRQLNFVFPEHTPSRLRESEAAFDRRTTDSATRMFWRLDQHLGRHRLTQVLSFADQTLTDFLPLSQGTNLPSTRQDFGNRVTMIGVSDTYISGSDRSPLVFTVRGQYRDEVSASAPSHPDAGPSTQLEIFSSNATGGFFGDLGQVTFGAASTPSLFSRRYGQIAGSAERYLDRHAVKLGAEFTRTVVRGVESNLLFNLLFATAADFDAFGPVNSGLFTYRTRGSFEPGDDRVRLMNNYTGVFVRDDWKIRENVTLNLGLRWDHDSAFDVPGNVSPRFGAVLGIDQRTVVRAHAGVYFDQIRLGQLRDIPAFGGAKIANVQPVSYPRLFYGVPTIAPIVFGLCLSPSLTDAEILSTGATCPLGPLPYIGVDRLNRVVAPGHGSIPANAVITLENVLALTGLTPELFLVRAAAALQRPGDFFFWGPFGTLSHIGSTTTAFPVTLDSRFRTPHTVGFGVSFERELTDGIYATAEYSHREIKNIAGVRLTNIAFDARLPGNGRHFEEPSPLQEIRGFGPWYRGTYDAIGFTLRLRRWDALDVSANYTYARAFDNLRCPDLVTGLTLCVPSDSFVGVVPSVIDISSGETNVVGGFVASNGNPVPRAGTFYNGPDLDRGPSDLAPDHVLNTFGSMRLPGRLALSANLRLQSGFKFSRQAEVPVDNDGDLNFNPIDHSAGRNRFRASAFVNLDLRLSRRWNVTEQMGLTALIEFFNLFNRRNPAAVETAIGRPVPFGKPLQVLPGRETQIGVRLDF